MLSAAEAVIAVDITQVNADPLPACEDGVVGLFGSSWPALRALTAYTSPRENTDLQSAIEELILEKDQALDDDPLKLQTRTQALDRLARDVTLGKVLDGPDSAFELACSRTGSWTLPMAKNDQMHLTALNVSILAYDPDELEGLLYRITEPPMHGSLYASTALSSTSYREVESAAMPYLPSSVEQENKFMCINLRYRSMCCCLQATAQTFMAIGGNAYQVRSAPPNYTIFLFLILLVAPHQSLAVLVLDPG